MYVQQFGFALRYLGLCICRNLRGGSDITGLLSVCLSAFVSVCLSVGWSVGRSLFRRRSVRKGHTGTKAEPQGGAVAAALFFSAGTDISGGRGRA